MKKYPFKFLDAYTRHDTDIFFGRQEEIDELYEMVFQNAILVVYGESGAGKTSLIQCGLAGRFKSYDWLALTIRRGGDINVSLEKELTDAGEKELDEEDMQSKDPAKKLTGLLRLIKAVYLKSFKPIYLIFDQFEELFILGTKAEQEKFIAGVKEILKAEQPVKMIFSIREEYLGYLYDFEMEVPQLLRKKLRIEPMTLDKVTDVINGINNYKLSNVRIKADETQAITREIFERLKGRSKNLTIQLPYLQVFLDKLYMETTGDESRKADSLITMEVLSHIGDIGDVLRNFLEEQVQKISRELSTNGKMVSIETIWKILSPFCTLDGTKEPMSKNELAKRLPEIDPKLIDQSVEAFVNSRILKLNEDVNLYELAHDSLALRIAEKRSDEEIAILEVQRLIKSQLSVKNEAREYFTERQLLFIEPYLSKFLVTEEEQGWLSKSRVYLEDQQRKQQEQTVKLQEAKATKKRLHLVYGLLGVTFLATIAAGYFGVTAKKQKDIATNEKNMISITNKTMNDAIDSISKVIFSLPQEDSETKRRIEDIQLKMLNKPMPIAKTDNIINTYNIGNTYQGGIIFFLYQSGDHGLIVSNSNQSDISTDWENANSLCSNIEEGKKGWRLPTANELKIIFSLYKKGAVNIGGIIGDLYWSSTPSNKGDNWVELINMSNGYSYYKNKGKAMGHKHLVRAVRDF